MPPEKTAEEKLVELLKENHELLEQNNELLHKLHRHSVWSFVVRTVAFLILIGAPVAIYYYIIEPYFTSVSEAMQTFYIGLEEAPGWSQLVDVLKGKEK
ncbi:hypothetical protein KC851_01320 [Candidatus Kaiserbacteria bacterium]|nr:hypothetical protein [Candidatus Kaiserbacteria bacterium]MCA9362936.1 hypothetical protein [Candidatus Kaiserbacteria bacterium]